MLSTDAGLGYLSSGWDRRGARPGRRPSLIIPDSLTQCRLWPRLVSGVGIQRRAKHTKAAVLNPCVRFAWAHVCEEEEPQLRRPPGNRQSAIQAQAP